MTTPTKTKQQELDRKRGALLGLAIGDLLAEHQTPHNPLPGGSPLPSDAQLACQLADSLVERAGYDMHDVAGRYVEWMRETHAGTESWAALDRLADVGGDPLQSARELWEQHTRRRAGCGALARSAPIGIWLARQPEARRMASLRDCAITHFDLRCQLANVAFNTGIAEALVAVDDRQAVVDAMEIELELTGELLAAVYPDLSDDANRLCAALIEDLSCARQPDQAIDRPTYPIGDRCPARAALRIAVWELLHAPSLEIGLLDAVYRARDATGAAAVAGALLGAYHGASAIPLAWQQRTLAACSDGLGRLAQHFSSAPVLRQVPRPTLSDDHSRPGPGHPLRQP